MKILKKLREQKGLSQSELAKQLQVSVQRYNNWETGCRFPTLEGLKMLASYYGITVDELTGGSAVTLPTVKQKEITLDFYPYGQVKTNATIEEIEASIRQDLEDVKNSFFQIGYKLRVVRDCKLYAKEGFDNLVDYAEARFGFGKTTTYNMLSVYDMVYSFKDNRKIKKDFEPYSFAQLTAMTASHWAQDSLPCYIKPDDTVEDIKKFIRVWNKENSKGNSIKGNTLKEVLELAEEQKPAEIKSYSADDHTKLMKDIDKLISPKKSDDVIPGQREIDVDSSEVVGEESFSFNYEQPDVAVPEVETILIDEASAELDKSFSPSTRQTLSEMFAQTVRSNVVDESSGQSTDQEIDSHNFKTDDERRTFIENVENYPTLVLHSEELGLTVRRCDFKNGAKLYRSEYSVYSAFRKKPVSECKYHLIVPEGDELPGTSVVCSDVSGKVWTMDGVAITYIVKYLAKHRREL